MSPVYFFKATPAIWRLASSEQQVMRELFARLLDEDANHRVLDWADEEAKRAKLQVALRPRPPGCLLTVQATGRAQIVHNEDDWQAVGQKLPQDPAERRPAAHELGGKAGGQCDVEDEQRHEAEQAGDKRIPRKAKRRGRNTMHSVSP